jgi:hypothetical protein
VAAAPRIARLAIDALAVRTLRHTRACIARSCES